MTARCASCSYPLTISDSVACYECSSYFHIDCAQLVGFPYYELSSDPHRNTFHCTTCKILPLPRRPYDSDSDSDCECTMPSRQLDYHLEGQSDFDKDMNEVKGSVQDLSDLCKDMLREINELKSINLTLRCCVENLRHDNDQRDVLIGGLRRRLELLENNLNTGIINQSEPDNWDVDRLGIDRDDEIERYMTPEPDCGKMSEFEGLVPENTTYDPEVNKNVNIKPWGDDSGVLSNLDLSHQIENQVWDGEVTLFRKKADDLELHSKNDETINRELLETEVNNEENEVTENDDYNRNVELKAEVTESKRSKDWTWNGDDAVEVGTEEETSVDEEECDTEESEVADTEAQGWETLNEGVRSEQEVEDINEVADYDLNKPRSNKEEDEEWEGQVDDDEENVSEKLHTGADISGGKYNVFLRNEIGQKDVQESMYLEVRTEDEMSEVSDQIFDERGEGELLLIEETVPEEGSVREEESAPVEGDQEKLEGVEVEVTDEEARLVEGDQPDGETGADGERSERQSRDTGEPGTEENELNPTVEHVEDGEVQSKEPIVEGEEHLHEEGEGITDEPPPPTEPEHTEEDLWMYLKETVTSVRPATVEEFIENLKGALQHVPEEYLKPVIDANIKRATSPSTTDGDHLHSEREADCGSPVPEEEDHLLSKEETTLHLEQTAELTLRSYEEQRDMEATTEADDGYPAVEASA